MSAVRSRRALLVWASVIGASAVVSGCKCSRSEPPPLERSAEICSRRAQWKKRLTTDCADCVGLAKSPLGCEQTNRSYSARCAPEQQDKTRDVPCEPVFQCANKCKPTECECLARCYEGQERCDRLAAAVDSCLERVCASYCQ